MNHECTAHCASNLLGLVLLCLTDMTIFHNQKFYLKIETKNIQKGAELKNAKFYGIKIDFFVIKREGNFPLYILENE